MPSLTGYAYWTKATVKTYDRGGERKAGKKKFTVPPQYTINLGLTEASLKKAKSLGLGDRIKPADDNHEHDYLVIKKKIWEDKDTGDLDFSNPPTILDSSKRDVTEEYENVKIGNKSKVAVAFRILEDYDNMPVLSAIQIHELIKVEADDFDDDDLVEEDAPAAKEFDDEADAELDDDIPF